VVVGVVAEEEAAAEAEEAAAEGEAAAKWPSTGRRTFAAC
jgi:hypothetical protein